MQLKDVGVRIATRDLQANGRRITVVIGRPEKFPEGEDYYCPYQIVGLGNERVRYAGGVDAVQALQLALEKIGADLYTSQEAQSKQLAWVGGNLGDLGFPVPEALLARDMQTRPAQIRCINPALVRRAQSLVTGVKVDLDTPLPAEDE